jgi:LuxR family maltose regulon positive regulatory protein
MLQSDLTLRDIGSELFVSRNTAKSHVASVYRKLGVTSRTAAVARARQLELI